MSGRAPNLGHTQTPVPLRGALWWMREHEVAEHAVTVASRGLDATDEPRYRAGMSQRLDMRLDHLELVEDVCDAIIDALRASAPPWVADATQAFFVRGEGLESIASREGKSPDYVLSTCYRALRTLDMDRLRERMP